MIAGQEMVTKNKKTDSKDYKEAMLASGRKVKLDRTEVSLGSRDMVIFGELCKLDFTLKTINSMEATELLEKSIGNRKTRKAHIGRLKNAMAYSHYFEIFNPIMLSRDGLLIDGHHRLEALRSMGDHAYDFLVISGYHPDTFKMLDQNVARGLVDVFTVKGYNNPRELTAAVKQFYFISNRFGLHEREAPDTTIGDHYLMQNPKLHDTTAWAITAKTILKCGAAPLAVMKYVYDSADEERSKEFWNNVLFPSCCKEDFSELAPIHHMYGDRMDCANPMHTVNTKILKEVYSGLKRRSKIGATASIPQNTICVWIHEAWLRFNEGKGMKSMGAESRRTKIWNDIVEITLEVAPTTPSPKL